MAKKARITVRKKGPDFGTGIAIVVMLGFIVASAFGCTPEWLQ